MLQQPHVLHSLLLAPNTCIANKLQFGSVRTSNPIWLITRKPSTPHYRCFAENHMAGGQQANRVSSVVLVYFRAAACDNFRIGRMQWAPADASRNLKFPARRLALHFIPARTAKEYIREEERWERLW